MDDYIRREDVIKQIENAQIIFDGENCGYCCEDISIESITAADVRDNVRGKWIKRERTYWVWKHDGAYPKFGYVYQCPFCGGIEKRKTAKYCWKCGADMRG